MNKLALNGLKFSGTQLLNTAAPNLFGGILSIRNKSDVKCDRGGKDPCKITIQETPCADSAPKYPPKKKKPKEKFVSIWCIPLCKPSRETCPYPTFDQLYYKRSDKLKRKYQRTWAECPKKIQQQKVCLALYEDKLPTIVRRPKSKRPKTASTHGTRKLCSLKEGEKGKSLCPKIRLPGCKPTGKDYKCRTKRHLADCIPPSPPYPSFSECSHPKLRKRSPHECECLGLRSMCEVWTALRKKAIL